MTGFERRVTDSGVVFWRGNTDDDAQAFLLEKLQDHSSAFIAAAGEMTNAIQGNLGELIVFWIGRSHEWPHDRAFKPANAYEPLGRISKSGLDLLWVHFDQSETRADFAVLQEVKTTTADNLSYAGSLASDYAKLFGTNPHLTLQTRLVAAKTELEYTMERADLVPRLTAMAAATPAASTKIRLVPTLIHDAGVGDPEATLDAVRTSIVGKGWARESVVPWSVALDDLGSRLVRLARGLP